MILEYMQVLCQNVGMILARERRLYQDGIGMVFANARSVPGGGMVIFLGWWAAAMVTQIIDPFLYCYLRDKYIPH